MWTRSKQQARLLNDRIFAQICCKTNYTVFCLLLILKAIFSVCDQSYFSAKVIHNHVIHARHINKVILFYCNG